MKPGEADAIVAGTHGDPFAILGVHREGRGLVARAFVPGAETLTAFDLSGEEAGTLACVQPKGVFEGRLTIRKPRPLRYRAGRGETTWWAEDPYSYGPVLGPMDDYYIGQGSHLRLFDKLGAHPLHHEGAEGTHFAVWAPNARRVSVVGPFNGWDGRLHVMRHRRDAGIWEIFLPGVEAGQPYKFEIVGASGRLLPPRSSRRRWSMIGATLRIAISGPAPMRAASRSPFTSCMPDPGSATPRAASSIGTRSARG